MVKIHLFCKKKLEHSNSKVFGVVPRYRKIFYGEDDKGESVTVEEFIHCRWKVLQVLEQYIDDCCVDETDVIGQKAQWLTHFS